MRLRNICCSLTLLLAILSISSLALTSDNGIWNRYSSCQEILGIAVDGNGIWGATSGGIIRWNKQDGSYYKYDTTSSPALESWDNPRVIGVNIYNNGMKLFVQPDGGLILFDDESWTNSNDTGGLEFQSIWKSVIDSKDKMWFTTATELISFDGTNWVKYSDESIGNIYRNSLAVDMNDNVLIASFPMTINRFDGEAWTSIPIDVEGSNNTIHAIVVDHDESIWVATGGLGGMFPLHCYNGTSWQSYSIEEIGLTDYITNLIIDKENVIWCASKQGVASYDGTTWKTYTTQNGLSDNDIISLYVDDDNIKYFGTSNFSLSSFDGTKWTEYTTDQKIISNTVRDITVDRNNKKWFSTSDGVASYNGTSFTDLPEMHVNISRMVLDSNNVVWIVEHNRLWRLDDGFWTWFDEPHLMQLDDDYYWFIVRDVFVDSKDNIWVLSDFTLSGYDGTSTLSCYDGTSWTIHLSENYFSGITEDKNNTIWVGSNRGISSYDGTSWTHYSEGTAGWGGNARTITVDENNVKWFGTGDEVYSFDGSKWSAYSEAYGSTVIVIDENNVKWFGTSHGVYSFNDHTWNQYTIEDGLISNSVTSLAVDLNNKIWVATQEGGVSCFDGETWKSYNVSDGLSSKNINAIAVDQNNVKWFGSEDWGVCSYNDGLPTIVNGTLNVPTSIPIIDNYPNPFNPSTTISFTLSGSGDTNLSIYNIAGQKVRELLDTHLSAGSNPILWDGCDDNGSPVSTGIYFARLICGEQQAVQKMMLMK